MLGKLAPYRKTIAATVTGVIVWAGVVVASAPAHITATEWVMLGTAVAVGLGVYTIPNSPAA